MKMKNVLTAGVVVSLLGIAGLVQAGTLPVGYTRLDSIQSTGSQWLDTGVLSASDVEAELDLQILSVGNSSTPFFGERVTNGKHFAFWAQQNSNKVAINYGSNDSGYTYSDAPSFSKRHLLRNEGSDLLVDGRTYYHPDSYKEFSTSAHLFVFVMATDNAGAVNNRQASIRLWGLKIWKAGTLVRDYVPCLNPSGAAGLYDLVDHPGEEGYEPFCGNLGTGDDFVTYAALPDDYTRQGFLESDGTAWIDTGVTSSSDLEVEMDMQILSVGQGSSCFFGERVTNGKHYALWAQQNTHKVAINNGSVDSGYNYNSAPSFSTRKVFRSQEARILVDGTQCYGPGSNGLYGNTAFRAFENAYTLYLFVMRTASGCDNRTVRMRLYELRIWKGGTLVRDLVPCLQPDGTPGLYDVAAHAEGDAAATNRFYGNMASSGAFTTGPWLTEPSLSLTEWELGAKKTAKINWGRTLGVPVTCSHTEEELAALPEGSHTVTFTAGTDTKTFTVLVYRPFTCTPSADGRTATFSFRADSAARTLTVGYGATDAGTNPQDWATTFTVNVPAGVTRLTDVALPEGFGAAFEQRALRGFLTIDGSTEATPIAYVEGPILVTGVRKSNGVPVEADLVFTPSHQVRTLYVACAKQDAGPDAAAWDAAGVTNVCDLAAGTATATVAFPEAVQALFRAGGEYRLFLEDTYLPENYTALQSIFAIGSQAIDTGIKPGPKTACTMDLYIDYGVAEGGLQEFGMDNYLIPQMRFFMSRAGMLHTELGPNDLFFEVYISGSGAWGVGLFDGIDGEQFQWRGRGGDIAPHQKVRTTICLDAKNRKFLVNGADVTPENLVYNTISKTAPTSLWLMGGVKEAGGNNWNFRGHCYGASITEDDVLVRSFVPCKNPSGEPGLYDRVGKAFYGSCGAIEFSAGKTVAGHVATLANGLPSVAAVSEPQQVRQMTVIILR